MKQGLTYGQGAPLVRHGHKQTARKSALPVDSSVLTPTETLRLVNRCAANSLPPGFCGILSPVGEHV